MENLREAVLATNNRNKVREFREILPELLLKPASDLTEEFSPEETGSTFYENAVIKANELYSLTKHPFIIAEDSGLEVFALNGAPGIFSSRFSEKGTDTSNITKLLTSMLNNADRRARFVCCAIALINGNKLISSQGYIYGKIAHTPLGTSGFGYDPVFIPEGYGKTFAQMRKWEKNSLSHRRNALEELRKKLKKEGVIT